MSTQLAAEYFRWRPVGVGRCLCPCPRCGGQTPVVLLENLFESLCRSCGRNLALENASRCEREEGRSGLLEILAGLGVEPLDDPGEEGHVVDLLMEGGRLRCDLRLTLQLAPGSHSYSAAPLKALVATQEVEQALEQRISQGGDLGELLRGVVLERLAQEIRNLGSQAGLETLESTAQLDPACAGALPLRAIQEYQAVPVRREQGVLLVALANPLDFGLLADLETLTQEPVAGILAHRAQLESALTQFGASPAEDAPDAEREEEPIFSPLEEDSLLGVLLEALEEGAHEVLVEPRLGASSLLRLRVGQELRKARLVAPELAHSLVERLSVSDPTELVSTGASRYEVSGLPLTLHWRVVRTTIGPAVTLQLDAPQRVAPHALEGLSLDAAVVRQLERALEEGGNLLVIAGPPYGGKTVAYRALMARASRTGITLSLEQSIERYVEGTTQLELAGLTAEATRSLLRPRPDWLGVDGLLADVSSDRLLTLVVDTVLAGAGAVVTLTAPDAQRALLRLEMAGIPRPLLAGTTVLSLRLLPRLCSRCRVRHGEEWVGLGCPACDQGTCGLEQLAEVSLVEEGGKSRQVVTAPLSAQARELVRRGDISRVGVSDLLE